MVMPGGCYEACVRQTWTSAVIVDGVFAEANCTVANAVDSITLIRMGATALVDLTALVVQGHLCLLQRPLVLSVMPGAI